MGGMEAMASTPTLSACLASSTLSAVLLQPTWAMTVILPLASLITASSTLLALIGVLVDALAGGAAHIHALDALGDQVAGEGFDALHGDIAVLVIAGIERGDNALILGKVFHDT